MTTQQAIRNGIFAAPAAHGCCGGPHSASGRNPRGHAIACEKYGDGYVKEGTGAEIFALVQSDLAVRASVGLAEYGVPLRAGNGRDALWDAYEEALDLAVYLRQAVEEARVASH